MSSAAGSSAGEMGSGSRGADFPNQVLPDTVAHMGRCRDNATTAVGETSDGRPIEVSFLLANPPALTHCVVHCSHLTAGAFFDNPPRVTAADAAFLLICVTFPKLLEAVITSCDDHCLVVVPRRRFDDDECRVSFNLHIYSSMTKLWTIKVVSLPCGLHYEVQFGFNKVFPLQRGGHMAWVDLRNGILICDVITPNPHARLIKLPMLMSTNAMRLGVGEEGNTPCLDTVRDVSFSNGWFNFIEMGFPELDVSTSIPLHFKWEASMFTLKLRQSDSLWQPCREFSSAMLSSTSPCIPSLLSDIYNNLHQGTLRSSCPILDPYNGTTVYMMTKMKPDDPNGWVLAINTKRKKIYKVAPFSAERRNHRRTYMLCGFSKHLSWTSGIAAGACNTDVWKYGINEESPLVLYVTAIMFIQQKLRQLEKYLTTERPSQWNVWSLLHSGVTSPMDVHVHQVAQYGATIGLGKAASDAENTFQLAIKDVEHLLLGYCWNNPTVTSKCFEEKINVAVGALDNLLHMLPSCLLDLGRSMISVDESVNEEALLRSLLPSSCEV